MGIQKREIRLTDEEKAAFTAEWNAAVTRLRHSGVDLSGILIVEKEKEPKKDEKAV